MLTLFCVITQFVFMHQIKFTYCTVFRDEVNSVDLLTKLRMFILLTQSTQSPSLLCFFLISSFATLNSLLSNFNSKELLYSANNFYFDILFYSHQTAKKFENMQYTAV